MESTKAATRDRCNPPVRPKTGQGWPTGARNPFRRQVAVDHFRKEKTRGLECCTSLANGAAQNLSRVILIDDAGGHWPLL
jgi:hypothetical protein